METETEEEYLLICDESSGSFSSSVSLSDRSIDNILEEYHSDAPFSGLLWLHYNLKDVVIFHFKLHTEFFPLDTKSRIGSFRKNCFPNVSVKIVSVKSR